MPTYALTEKAIVLKPEDDVAVARAPLPAGTVLEDGAANQERALRRRRGGVRALDHRPGLVEP